MSDKCFLFINDLYAGIVPGYPPDIPVTITLDTVPMLIPFFDGTGKWLRPSHVCQMSAELLPDRFPLVCMGDLSFRVGQSIETAVEVLGMGNCSPDEVIHSPNIDGYDVVRFVFSEFRASANDCEEIVNVCLS